MALLNSAGHLLGIRLSGRKNLCAVKLSDDTIPQYYLVDESVEGTATFPKIPYDAVNIGNALDSGAFNHVYDDAISAGNALDSGAVNHVYDDSVNAGNVLDSGALNHVYDDSINAGNVLLDGMIVPKQYLATAGMADIN